MSGSHANVKVNPISKLITPDSSFALSSTENQVIDRSGVCVGKGKRGRGSLFAWRNHRVMEIEKEDSVANSGEVCK